MAHVLRWLTGLVASALTSALALWPSVVGTAPGVPAAVPCSERQQAAVPSPELIWLGDGADGPDVVATPAASEGLELRAAAEVSTLLAGHFNAWPVVPDAGTHTEPDVVTSPVWVE